MSTRKLILLLISPLLVLLSCRQPSGDAKRDFLPGRYENSAEGEFSKAWDTLVIEPTGGQDFKILRSTGFRRKQQDRLLELELRRQVWTAVFDPRLEVLQVDKSGKQIRVFPDSAMIMVGSRKYRKIR